MVTDLVQTLLITKWVPLQMWLLYSKYNLLYFLPIPMWSHFSLPQYYLCLKIKLSLTIKDWFTNFTKIREKCSAKLSKWIANGVLQTINSIPVLSTFLFMQRLCFIINSLFVFHQFQNFPHVGFGKRILTAQLCLKYVLYW